MHIGSMVAGSEGTEVYVPPTIRDNLPSGKFQLCNKLGINNYQCNPAEVSISDLPIYQAYSQLAGPYIYPSGCACFKFGSSEPGCFKFVNL
jgi:hypothetical protein